ncbi:MULTISPECIES: GNAT family N-acetyltransferase [Empedobacter]|uniref:Protease synthase and sporulation negative regulatory protein PAI 1 n=4 Tax=Weeksellaceae TaxID=2762318 RepID=A0A376G7K2_9FLAO|nr:MULTISPECIES: GNAT family N-acetyltransferase [Empedobacter]MDH2206892.1 GNAT family N-acetyltransferase [Empedobacter sp. GD03644]STD55720.1 Protease synthase and sporulation negative regulatory protein PAI 1 [Empedobacter falsenii]
MDFIILFLFSVQYYFLAKFFKKNKVKTILSVIGMYFFGIVLLVFALVALKVTSIIDIDIMNPVELSKSKFVWIGETIIFLFIGVFYYYHLKRKWTMEMFSADIEKRKDEILQNLEVNQKINPVKLDVYPHFHTVNEKNIHLVQPLANEIWNECYKDLLSQDQINYMIDMMYNTDKVNEGIANGDVWEILKIDNVPSGYLHYKLDENNTVFLSKIYLKESNQTKGIGQLMLNRVVDYAREKGAKAVHLTVNKHNAKAIRFYEKNGFKNMESKTFDIGNGYIMDDYIYQKSI